MDDQKPNNNDFEFHSDTDSGDAIIESSLLLRNMMVETKDHSCVQCEKSFSNKSNLNRHEKISYSKKIIFLYEYHFNVK